MCNKRNAALLHPGFGRLLLLAGLAGPGVPGRAAPAPAPATAAAPASMADNLGRIESETLLLKAQERQMAVKLQLVQQQNDLAQRRAETSRLVQPSRAGDPAVVSVEGIGRNAYATLMMENGGMQEVGAGDALPNGMTVLSVRAGEVMVLKGGKQRIRLANAVLPSAGAPGMPAAGARTPWSLPALPPLATGQAAPVMPAGAALRAAQ